MFDFYIDDDREGTLDFDHEAAAKAGYFGIPIEDLDDIAYREIEKVRKGQ
ncbi:hypothetical protein HBO32_26340 [Pseudomonas nitroreducens]|nr:MULTISPECIES: hypothetical protein [Pseudomonas]NMZ76642.1 hypothetical protein [Pseudomonas nitroreducens]